MSKLIKRLRERLDYDSQTGALRWKVKPIARIEVGTIAGSVDANGYLLIQSEGKKYKAHRLAWLFCYGDWPKNQIDHINHDKVDNRIENLRDVTPQDNQRCQQAKDIPNHVLGVGWHKASNKWMAHISVGNKAKYIGVYKHWFDAVCARKAEENMLGFHQNHGREALAERNK